MTTATPPEKMMELHDLTDADLAEALRLHADIFRDRDNQPIPASYLWREAARRLRVGDGPPKAEDVLPIDNAAAVEWASKYIRHRSPWGNLARCYLLCASSAPPAASAEGVGDEVYLSAVQGRRDFRAAYARMLKACREARRKLEKGRALWNGPCHETAAVLDEALNGPSLSALPKGQEHEG